MNDEETVALIAGGHTFGKCHGNGDPSLLGPEPEGCPVEHQGFGWSNANGTGRGKDTITSGLEGAWTPTPVTWDNSYFETLFGYEWELGESPAGAKQWHPKDGAGADAVPDAHDASVRHAPMMLTSDLALRLDPVYEPISRRFLEHPDELALAFAKAWYKLLHRDMGPVSRYLGPWVAEAQLWQDPVPAVDHELVDDADVAALKAAVLASGLSVAQLVGTAWASAASFRGTDNRGGANGARIRLEPQRSWEANDPATLATVLSTLEGIQAEFNERAGGKRISLADLIVLAGGAAIEQAAAAGGHDVDRAVRAGPHRRLAGPDRRRGVRRARAAGGRLPQLPPRGREAGAGDVAARPGQPAAAHRTRDDGARRRFARPRRQHRGHVARRPHRPARNADQRRVREPARHGDRVEAVRVRGERLRRPRPGLG